MSFFTLKFNICPPMQKSHCRSLNININHIYEKTLSIIQGNKFVTTYEHSIDLLLSWAQVSTYTITVHTLLPFNLAYMYRSCINTSAYIRSEVTWCLYPTLFFKLELLGISRGKYKNMVFFHRNSNLFKQFSTQVFNNCFYLNILML